MGRQSADIISENLPWNKRFAKSIVVDRIELTPRAQPIKEVRRMVWKSRTYSWLPRSADAHPASFRMPSATDGRPELMITTR
ncbi:hypothetical protein RMSM_02809 [Rhodopirellula maiorica SM1]|uniref:Uncharacterized protein n=1 Tax=Rhodopirellula maiorica SM1 TaxID=1265738 RepID=M5RLR1_9BACT|nr:hypothetical protein RMSM_02809 [Rhodopirellula maiorica SM1]